jgi:hypothetical protein
MEKVTCYKDVNQPKDENQPEDENTDNLSNVQKEKRKEMKKQKKKHAKKHKNSKSLEHEKNIFIHYTKKSKTHSVYSDPDRRKIDIDLDMKDNNKTMYDLLDHLEDNHPRQNINIHIQIDEEPEESIPPESDENKNKNKKKTCFTIFTTSMGVIASSFTIAFAIIRIFVL